MTRIPGRAAIAVLAVAGLLLAGCSSDPAPAPSGTPAASAPTSANASATPSPAPSSTLSAAKQRVVNEAVAVILAYRQLFFDLLADPDPRLNDFNDLVTDPQLELDLNNTSMLLRAGETVIESAGPVTIAAVEPVTIDLKSDPPTVTLLVCVDASAVSGTEAGKPFTGSRQEMQYRVVKTGYLPDPGWAVAEVLPPKGTTGSRPC